MQVTSTLNLALPVRSRLVETELPENPEKRVVVEEPLLWLYHQPISMDLFEANWRIIAATKQAIFGKSVGYAYESGPRIARLALLDAAKADAAEFGTPDVGSAFLETLKTRTTILAPGKEGGAFTYHPIDYAVTNKIVTADEWAEALSALVFFTCAYAMARPIGREAVAASTALLLRGLMTSFTLTEFADSLKPSTSAETSEPKPSSVPV